MSRRVKRTPRAKADLVDHYEFIGKENPDAAERFLDAAEETFKDLARMPGMGRVWSFESPRLIGVRRWRVKDFPHYLIYYRPLPKKGGVEILHVRHAARDVPDDQEIQP